MRCKNYFCIYWADSACLLQEVTLDIQGRCQECIYVDIAEDVLKKEREMRLGSK